ncbi:hypothetical protein [Ohtaekwangia koreensis]|uniref:hypothetical protein n=1 Tax=Ohtaekwangia koreensis TaxID=688867 RepID=UPI0009A8D567|nr:hypothetical protein [Ohtaekwangia koreensis]
MKCQVYFIVAVLLLVLPTHSEAQDGKILSKEPLVLPDSVVKRITMFDPVFSASLKTINLYKIHVSV